MSRSRRETPAAPSPLSRSEYPASEPAPEVVSVQRSRHHRIIDGSPLDLTFVRIACLVGICGALLVQFNHALKPLLVFAATPYEVVGAVLALALMGTPFGFMAFLGVISLVGVIVSHVIV